MIISYLFPLCKIQNFYFSSISSTTNIHVFYHPTHQLFAPQFKMLPPFSFFFFHLQFLYLSQTTYYNNCQLYLLFLICNQSECIRLSDIFLFCHILFVLNKQIVVYNFLLFQFFFSPHIIIMPMQLKLKKTKIKSKQKIELEK